MGILLAQVPEAAFHVEVLFAFQTFPFCGFQKSLSHQVHVNSKCPIKEKKWVFRRSSVLSLLGAAKNRVSDSHCFP